MPKVIEGFNQLAYAINDVQEHIELHKMDPDNLDSIIAGSEFLAAWWGVNHTRIGDTVKEVIKVIDVHDDIVMFDSAEELIGYLKQTNEESHNGSEEQDNS